MVCRGREWEANKIGFIPELAAIPQEKAYVAPGMMPRRKKEARSGYDNPDRRCCNNRLNNIFCNLLQKEREGVYEEGSSPFFVLVFTLILSPISKRN